MTNTRARRLATQRGGMFIVAAAAMSLVVGSTSAGLRVVNYNVAQMRGNAAAMADVFAALDIDEKPGFAAPVDVYVFQEVRNADVAVLFSALPANFALAPYTNQSEDNFAGAQALFYRVTKLAEDVSAHQDISRGAGRRPSPTSRSWASVRRDRARSSSRG